MQEIQATYKERCPNSVFWNHGVFEFSGFHLKSEEIDTWPGKLTCPRSELTQNSGQHQPSTLFIPSHNFASPSIFKINSIVAQDISQQYRTRNKLV